MSLTEDSRALADVDAVGAGISEVVAGQTLTSWFLSTVSRTPDGVALVTDDGEARRSWTWREYAEDASRVAGGLRDLGIERGDRVALMMRNRPELHLADLGTLLVAGTPFSIYNSSAPPQIEYLLAHSEARMVIVEDAEFLERVLAVRDRLPGLRHVVVLDVAAAGDGVLAFDELLQATPVDLPTACASAQPEDLVNLVYTSGTTGPPKGAMSTHDRVCWTLESFRRRMDIDMAGKRILSYLPMAHVLERDVSHYLHILCGAQVTTCPDPAQVGVYLRRVRPQFFAAVPRVWEKLCSALKSQARTSQQEAEFQQALAIGHRVATARLAGAAIDEELRGAHATAEEAVLRPAREALGLDACESALTGGAPIPDDILEFFLAIGVPLGEGYGLTESTFVVTFDALTPRVGSVGRALPGITLQIAEDGEVLARGPFVFRGYLKDEAKTAEAVDADGWLHTGDIGELDADGYLRIVDRKKELIITGGGKNVAPSNIEAALKAHPLIGQVCVFGDRRPYLVALVVLDPEAVPGWAQDHGLPPMSLAEMAADPVVRGEVAVAVAAVNRELSRAEGVKRVALLHEEWLPDSEELTPTMKLKRRGILAKHQQVIDRIYQGDPATTVHVEQRSTTDHNMETSR